MAFLPKDGGSPSRPPPVLVSQDRPLILHFLQPAHLRQDLGQLGSRLVPEQIPGQPAGVGAEVSGRTVRSRGRDKLAGGEGWGPTTEAATQEQERPLDGVLVCPPQRLFSVEVVPSCPQPQMSWSSLNNQTA